MRIVATKLFSALLLSSIFLSAPVFASKGGEQSDSSRVISLTTDDLAVILDKNTEFYSLSAVRDGNLIPIPYQFDEHTENGFVYMKDLPKKMKKKDPIVGREIFFDGQDELIFMFKDAGPRKTKNMRADGKLVAEIAVDDYRGKKRYVYLTKDALLEPEDYYVRFSSELGRVETDYYSLAVDPKNAFTWKQFNYPSYDGPTPGRPIDTIKLRLRSLVGAAVPLQLNNKHMVAKVLAEKSGPIRSTTQYKVTVTFLKSPVMKFALQILHHEQALIYDSKVTIPAIRRRMVAKSTMVVALDGNDLEGAESWTSRGPIEPGIVDGAISSTEEQMIAAGFKNHEDSWYFINTHQGFSSLVNFRVDAEHDIPMSVVYEESPEKSLKPEFFPGQMPAIGFKLDKVPLSGGMRVITNYRMFDKDIDIPAHEFGKHVVRKPSVFVRSL